MIKKYNYPRGDRHGTTTLAPVLRGFFGKFWTKVFFLFVTKNLLHTLDIFLESENNFSKIINKKSEDYTFFEKSSTYPNGHISLE